ncbi:hypothetical protein C9374_009513 [Naegleria lovaniensis]|uniref:CHCH domain-containing protein n=1 Tax=Naegleria lovaniensis TaxID=51637 RepID=A0AA88H4Z7_NAELO|nr:uncharacterized protein C9374_009513 [Naegleria lovaniensis]KAG2392936.1 hypothetical protein C9374_009513 [Naegleria lovaniensis]
MHHSISLTTNFVKSFFPGNGLTNQNNTQQQQQPPSTQATHAPLEEQNLPTSSATANHYQQEQQQQAIDFEPSVPSSSPSSLESNISEKVETTQVSSPANSRSVEQTPAAVESVKPISAEEFRLVKFKYDQLKNQQNRLLEHLQDARVEHLQEEIAKLDKLIPHHRTIQSYGCTAEKSALVQCLKNNGNVSYGTLNCSNLLNEFSKCAQEKRRSFLGNQDL